MAHILFKDIVLEHLNIVKIGKGYKLYYKNNPLQILTDTLYTPFGVKSFENTYSSFSNFHLDCSVSEYKTQQGKEIINEIQEFDNRVMELLMNSDADLFKDKGLTKDSYSPFLKPGKGDYPGLMKINLSRDPKGNFETVVFNDDKMKLPLSEEDIFNTLRKGISFKSILECSRVWYYNGRFGATFIFKQIKLCKREIEGTTSTEPPKTLLIDSDCE